MNHYSTRTNYWSLLRMTGTGNVSKISIRSSTGYKIFLTAIKINILLVNLNSTSYNYTPEVYSYSSRDGNVYSKTFIHNFGVNSSLFGSEASGYCLQGLVDIDLYHYASSYEVRETSFLFTYSGSEVSDIAAYSTYGIKLSTSCFGYCPQGQLLTPSGCSCQLR